MPPHKQKPPNLLFKNNPKLMEYILVWSQPAYLSFDLIVANFCNFYAYVYVVPQRNNRCISKPTLLSNWKSLSGK